MKQIVLNLSALRESIRKCTPRIMDVVKKYNHPTCRDTAVCMCFFSPVGFKKPKQNFLHIEKILKEASVPTFTAECVIGNQSPFLENPTLQVRSKSPLFYKEQLYNLLVPRIPEQYTKLIFLDADILFDEPNWVDIISRTLNDYDIVQPFQNAVWLGPHYGSILKKNTSFMYGLLHDRASLNMLSNYHQGFSYAMTRKFFNDLGGFFDKCVIGSGDTAFARLFLNIDSIPNFTIIIQAEYTKWLSDSKIFQKTFTYLPFTVYHLYHGSLENRNYIDRHKLLEKFSKKSWDDIFYKNSNGMYETSISEINTAMQQYFLSRKEDDIPHLNLSILKYIRN